MSPDSTLNKNRGANSMHLSKDIQIKLKNL